MAEERKNMEQVTEETAKTAETAEKAEQGTEQGYKQIDEITLKFGKGCVGDEFTGKDGNNYREILIPNKDENDHRPWQTFVVKSNHVHENQFGKGMWCKVPAEGHTTLHRGVKIGEDEQGKGIYETEKTVVTNKELKSMVEAYKERPRESVQEKLAEKKDEVEKNKSHQKEKSHTKNMTQHKAKAEAAL